MRIQHNVTGLRTANSIKYSIMSWKSSAEKLSSGYRVNRAADDAASLTISEKLRSQIRGLNQAANNIADGISLANVADGALSEVSDMLHRQTELLIKSANGTNTDEDRNAIQGEINHLSEEMEDIFSSTSFNTRKLFKGKDIILQEYDTSDVDINSTTREEDNTNNEGVTVDPTVKSYSTSEQFLGNDQYGRPSYRFTYSEIYSTTTVTRTTNETNLYTQRDIQSHVTEHMPEHIMIQSGADSEDAIAIRVFNLSIDEYGMNDVDASTGENARASLETVESFNSRISEIRSYFGAITNRMEHAYKTNLNTSENLQASDSRLRDTDIAQEVLSLAKKSIIEQASQSIMAQSNQSRESILNLL